MRKQLNLEFLFVLLFLWAGPGQSEKSNTLIYQNQKYNYQFTYPGNWKLQIDKANPAYLALFDPKALSTLDISHELLIGIKIEVYADFNQEDITQIIAGCSVSPSIKSNGLNVKLTQYWTVENDCLIIIVPFKNEAQNIVFIAFIPEEKARQQYWQQFNQIVLTYKQIKSG